MKHQEKRTLNLLLCVGLLSGCVQVPKTSGFPDVKQMIRERVPYRVHWNQGSPEDAEVTKAIRGLLAKELTVDSAVQIALLNNRSLQAAYEGLGITQADVVQAGLLRNPTFFGAVLFPDRPDRTKLELEVAQDFLDTLMLPARKQLAASDFKRAKLTVGSEIIRFDSEVREAYYTLAGAKQVASMRRAVAQVAEATVDIARRMHEAGNISDLGLTNQRGFYEQARVEWAEAEAEILAARERLNGLMGLWRASHDWKVRDQLPDLPKKEIPLDRLEALAVAKRLDLAAARQEVETIGHALSIARKTRGIVSAHVGVGSEREVEGLWVVGPALEIELPIFDQGQARIARLEAQVRQAEQRHAALAVEIRSEVRALRDRLVTTRDLIEQYRGVLIPVRERIVALTLQRYNFMLTGVFELVVAKQNEFNAYQAYIEAFRGYWVVRSKLQRAVGGRLPAARTSQLPTRTVMPSMVSSSMKPRNHFAEGEKR